MKKVLITGANKGIGLEMSKQLERLLNTYFEKEQALHKGLPTV